MGKILTAITGMHEHYLTACFANIQMACLAQMLVTASGTVTAQSLSNVASSFPVYNANTQIFLSVDGFSHILAPVTFTLMAPPVTAIANVPVTAGGTGYTQGAAVTATAGTVSGFAGFANVSNGVITSVSITNPGSYTVVPTGFTCAGGTGATFGAAVLGTGLSLGTVTVPTGAPMDTIIPFALAGSIATAAPYGFTVNITGAQSGTNFSIFALDNTASLWYDMGMNYAEGLDFADGPIASPVARGWSNTDHSKRIPTTNNWHVNQLYCSQYEGIASLRGKTFMIQDQVHTDGGATIKEITYVLKATVENSSRNIGGGGGNHNADSVNCTGYYMRKLVYTLDATAITATN